jgi:hypothetical protein
VNADVASKSTAAVDGTEGRSIAASALVPVTITAAAAKPASAARRTDRRSGQCEGLEAEDRPTEGLGSERTLGCTSGRRHLAGRAVSPERDHPITMVLAGLLIT